MDHVQLRKQESVWQSAKAMEKMQSSLNADTAAQSPFGFASALLISASHAIRELEEMKLSRARELDNVILEWIILLMALSTLLGVGCAVTEIYSKRKDLSQAEDLGDQVDRRSLRDHEGPWE